LFSISNYDGANIVMGDILVLGDDVMSLLVFKFEWNVILHQI